MKVTSNHRSSARNLTRGGTQQHRVQNFDVDIYQLAIQSSSRISSTSKARRKANISSTVPSSAPFSRSYVTLVVVHPRDSLPISYSMNPTRSLAWWWWAANCKFWPIIYSQSSNKTRPWRITFLHRVPIYGDEIPSWSSQVWCTAFPKCSSLKRTVTQLEVRVVGLLKFRALQVSAQSTRMLVCTIWRWFL